MNGGLMDKFVDLLGTTPANNCFDAGKGNGLVMGYYDGNTVTALWNYAQHFAMSDSFFSTNFGPSTLGALNLISGQTHGATVVRDPAGSGPTVVKNGTLVGDIRPAFDDCVPATATVAALAGPNVGDLLNKKGLAWGWFQGGFKPSSQNPDGRPVCGSQHTQFDGTASVPDYVANHEPFQFYASTANPHHLPPASVAMIGQQDAANQYDLADFFAALAAGNLAAVSFLKAPAYQDGHAFYSNPLDEQTFLVETINALESSPFWDSTVAIVAYDDSDGWYDHVMPPIVNGSASDSDALSGPGVCGTAVANAPMGRCGYGQRLPLLAISSFAKTNYVDHSVTDQSSILRFIEDNFGLGRIDDTSFDNMAGTLANMLEFDTGGTTRRLFLDPATGLPQ